MAEHAPQLPPARLREIHTVSRPSPLWGPLAIGVICVGALYFARDIFVPLAPAILLSFTLGPLVLLLRRWHLGRVPSVIASVGFAFLLIFAIGALIGSQLARLAAVPKQYRRENSRLARHGGGSGIVERTSEMVKNLKDEITKTAPPADDKTPSSFAPAPQGAPQQQPLAVEIHQPGPTGLQIVQTILGPLLQPLAPTGIVIIFVIFFLLQREDLRDRFIRLAGARDLQRTTRALDEAGHRLSRYLLVQTAINACFGLLVGIGL
jgi:predicted PurR-regulated permease PerM